MEVCGDFKGASKRLSKMHEAVDIWVLEWGETRIV